VRELASKWGLPCGLLAVSARNAPQFGLHHTTVHQLADDAFLTALDQRYRAIPDDVRNDPDMRRLYLPLLRADVTMLETYRFRADEPLSCPISVYGGTDDLETTTAALAAWRELTSAGANVRMLPGGHFFLRTHRAELLAALEPDLLSTLIP
jgi:medium-chain acyl-[acyl-carrier-protein] hydrolase